MCNFSQKKTVDGVAQTITGHGVPEIKNRQQNGEPAKITPAENPVRLLSPKGFGERIGLGSATIRKMVKAGQLKALRLNARVIRLSESELSRLKVLAL